MKIKMWNKPRSLPLTENLLRLKKHFKEISETTRNTIKQGFSMRHGANFNEAIMIQILIFNRKHVGDVQRINVEEFKKAHNIQKESVTYQLLTESEKLISAQYMRIEVTGKHTKVVPIILTKNMMTGIKQILSLRKAARILSTNQYALLTCVLRKTQNY